MADILSQASISLSARQRLEREKAANKFQSVFKDLTSQQFIQIETFIFDLLSCAGCWEARHGGFLLANVYLKWLLQQQQQQQHDFAHRLTDVAMKTLLDKQIILRLIAGETLGLLCGYVGVELYAKHIQEPLLKTIEENMYLERDDHADESEEGKKLREKLLAGEAAQQAKIEALKGGDDAKSVSQASSKSSIFHDTAGWKSLETDVKALDQIIKACKEDFALYLTNDLLELISQCAVHVHRFVRGLSFRIICTIFENVGLKKLEVIALSSDLVSRLASGLTDAWPEVRMDASVATRAFFQHLLPALTTESDTASAAASTSTATSTTSATQTTAAAASSTSSTASLEHLSSSTSTTTIDRQKQIEVYYDILLPRMCINRYFVADGVRSYSQATWAMLFGQRGKDLVAQFCPSFVQFYLAQTQVSSFEMREAVCHCIGELVSKIASEVVRPFVDSLVQGVISMSAHATWPVKIAAGGALARCVENFPKECERFRSELYTSLTHQLHDRTWSVREQAAVTLGVLAKSYPGEYTQQIVDFALKGVPSARFEEDDNKKYNTDSPQAAKQLHDNDFKLHSNQNMFDCCSAGALPEGEEHSHSHSQWELSDGCFYLIRELSAICPIQIEPGLSAMAEVACYKHYLRHTQLQETLFKVLPVIAKQMGKRNFKQHLEGFFDVMAMCIGRTADRRVQAQATTCIKELIALIGPMIFEGRLKQYNPDLLEDFSRIFPELRS